MRTGNAAIGPLGGTTAGHLNVAAEEGKSILLYSADGRLLLNRIAAKGITQMDVSHLAAGVYLLRVDGESKSVIIQ